MVLSEKYIFNLLKQYFKKYGPWNTQIKSYENFINEIQMIIDEEPVIEIEVEKNIRYIVKFGKCFLNKPVIIEENRKIRYPTPNECLIRDLNYLGILTINIDTYVVKILDNNTKQILEHKKYHKHEIAKIPVMVGSSKCNLYKKTKNKRIQLGQCVWDNGGYFIINGKERVIIAQERASHNTIRVYPSKNISKYFYYAEIRSLSEETGHSVLIKSYINKNGKNISFSLPYITSNIPAGIVLKALGCDYDDIYDYIGINIPKAKNLIKFLVRESFFIKTKEEALSYIGEFAMHTIPSDKRTSYSDQLLSSELFPHLGIINSDKEKILFLCLIINKLLKTYLGVRPIDDRDNISNKRVETTGTLMRELFRALYKRFVRGIQPQLSKRADIIVAISRLNNITQGMRHCFATGNWGIQKNSYIRTGVSQVLSRLSYGGFISHLQRIVIPIGKEGKNTQIRQLHGSQIGFICPCETPEGQAAGIVKNFALTTTVTKYINPIVVREEIENIPEVILINSINPKDIQNNYKIFLNGIWIGIVNDFNKIFENLNMKKNNKLIPESVSISYNKFEKEIHIYSDEGRLRRPLICVKNQKSLLTDDNKLNWDDLVQNNIIKYIDSYESEMSVIAMKETELKISTNFDYLEIHPSLMLGIMASIIPFPDHTQSPRNTYQASMGKQALGVYSLSNNIRCDTIVHTLHYPQKPIVKNHLSKYLGFDDMPSGINAIVAIGCYSGFNQEDSIIMNKSAIDRGLFRTFCFRTISACEKKCGNNGFENIEIPKQQLRLNSQNYSKLDKFGVIKVGSSIKQNDVLIGKIYSNTSKNRKDVEYKDVSVVAKANEEGIVDRVFTTYTNAGYKLVKVKIRINKIPEIGDKFASRSAQKGTIGMVYRHEDMPFTKDGLVPDIIMNPHAFPSRMTINQLFEGLCAKIGSYKGEEKYCTPFTSFSTNSMEKICEELQSCGMNKYGEEKMYNGFTGKPFKSTIFITPIYYQRLKHLVSEKYHARDHGNIQSLTRQPLEGRSRDGGLRFGEMERDCMIAHGVASFLRERLFTMSDKYTVPLCNSCGFISDNYTKCTFCENNIIDITNIPYACKLLFQELTCLGLKIKIKSEL